MYYLYIKFGPTVFALIKGFHVRDISLVINDKKYSIDNDAFGCIDKFCHGQRWSHLIAHVKIECSIIRVRVNKLGTLYLTSRHNIFYCKQAVLCCTMMR